MPKAQPSPDAELEALRRKVEELEDECQDLRATNEELSKRDALAIGQKQAEEFLATTIDSLPEGFLYFDPDDRLVLVNSKIANIYPLVADVFVPGVSFETCMRAGVDRGQWGPKEGEDKEQWIQERLSYHYNPEGAAEFNLPDGRCIRVEEKKTTAGGIVGVRTDITDLKKIERQLRDSEERFNAFFENSPAAIYLKDQKGRFVMVNKEFEQVQGLDSKEIIGKTSFDIFPKKIAEQFTAQDKRILAGGSFLQEEIETVFKDGKTGIILTTKFPIIGLDGTIEGIGGINLDFTERKEVEKMKHDFISIASHELRTPLTSLKGALGLINADVIDQIPEKMKPILEIAYRNSERLARLIDDILRMEKIDAGKMEFSMQLLQVPSLISQAISEHAGFGIEHGVSFVVEGEVPKVSIAGDEVRLMQVFSNLMSNAAKFSSPGTVVRLSARENGEDVRISIKDEGQGIPKEFQEKMFDKFSRANTSDTGHHGGTGLGLSIAKAIVERHGGDLLFETEMDVGTTFYFELPKAD